METNVSATVTARAPTRIPPGLLPHLVNFFDPDHDGKIGLGETYAGLRRLDIGRLSSLGIAAGINVGLAMLSDGNPFALDLTAMGHTRHPGDSAVVDDTGSFHDDRLEQLFSRYGHTYDDALTARELVQLGRDDLRARGRLLTLPRDVVAIIGEWGLLWWAGGEERDGRRVLTKRRVREFFTDPTLFDRMARENQDRRSARGRTVAGRLINAFHSWIF